MKWFKTTLILLGYYITTGLHAADSYAHDIHLSSERITEYEEHVTIAQKKSVITTIQDKNIYKIFQGDLNGDGFEELILESFSGGAHCCFQMAILQLRPNTRKPYTFALNNAESAEYKDLDNDGIAEIITYDDRYSYFASLCFACSPFVKIIVNFDGDKLVLRPKLMEKFAKPNNKPLKVSTIGMDKLGNIELDSTHAPAVVEVMLHDFYVGKTQSAIKTMKTYFRFEHPALRRLFLDALVEAMSRSPFFEQLCELNGWYEHTPSKEYDKPYQIVWHLFEMFDKTKL